MAFVAPRALHAEMLKKPYTTLKCMAGTVDTDGSGKPVSVVASVASTDPDSSARRAWLQYALGSTVYVSPSHNYADDVNVGVVGAVSGDEATIQFDHPENLNVTIVANQALYLFTKNKQ
jgi:hypothetical protein